MLVSAVGSTAVLCLVEQAVCSIRPGLKAHAVLG